MRIRWRGLELPTRVVNDEDVSTPRYGKFTVEPFERGFGTTVGNALRRILLSSLEGAAVTQIKLAGADHEFTSLPGVLEDVADIVLNIKQLVLKSHSEEPKVLHLRSEAKGPVTAGMIDSDPSVEIINEDLVIATLTDDVAFDLEMTVQTGRGFVPADELVDPEEDQEVGVIHTDAAFSPVTRVRYGTENTRVGQKTNYDRLLLEVWTNGTLTPEMAVVEAAKILRKHLNPFVQYFELGEQIVETGTVTEEEEVDQELQSKLDMSVQELDLSVRANNCLESAKVETVGQLVQYQESDLLKIRSFGKTSLREVKRKLTDLGLSLGMKVPMSSPEPVQIES
jgi:DNA-directed RNA polymerase subunit alpha